MDVIQDTVSEQNSTLAFQAFSQLKDDLSRRIIGQAKLIERLLISLLCDGHLIVEGAPGLAKTRAIRELSQSIEGDFHRIQFTPDLLPADITGTEIYRYQEGSFSFQSGPIFHNLILADEINRAPAKVQSALLEAMAERQVTIGNTSYPLPKLFLVMATQNPIEQEGTYTLPEAQLDRFLMFIKVDYPSLEAERDILKLARLEAHSDLAPEASLTPRKTIAQDVLFAARKEILNVFMAPALEEYLVQFIIATRQPERYNPELAQLIAFGASPRATISLDRTARAHAWLQGRHFVSPGDIHAVIHDVLRHRIILSLEAIAEQMTADRLIDELLTLVPVP